MEENKRQTCPSVISSLKRENGNYFPHFHTFTLSHFHLLEEGGSHNGNYLPHFTATHSGLSPPPVLDQISFLFFFFAFLIFILSYLLRLWDVDHVNIRSLICMLHRSRASPLAAAIMSSAYIITQNIVHLFFSFLFKYQTRKLVH